MAATSEGREGAPRHPLSRGRSLGKASKAQLPRLSGKSWARGKRLRPPLSAFSPIRSRGPGIGTRDVSSRGICEAGGAAPASRLRAVGGAWLEEGRRGDGLAGSRGGAGRRRKEEEEGGVLAVESAGRRAFAAGVGFLLYLDSLPFGGRNGHFYDLGKKRKRERGKKNIWCLVNKKSSGDPLPFRQLASNAFHAIACFFILFLKNSALGFLFFPTPLKKNTQKNRCC